MATKKTSTTTKKPSTSTRKKTTSKRTSSSSSTKKSTSSTTKKRTRKPASKIDDKPKTPPKMPRKKTTKKKSTTKKSSTPKKQGRVKDKSELTTLEALEATVEGTEIRERQPLGRVFYLVFSIVFYALAFFYINTSVYAGDDYIESAIFAFAALFIAFVLMLFNVHVLIYHFFTLPIKRLFKQAKAEANKEIIYSVGKNKVQSTFNKYRSIFTLVLYFLFGGLLITASVLSSIAEGDVILDIIYSALIVFLIYMVVINSWQFLFHIIPSILEKSIDAKNGYVLTLSAAVIVIYIVFMIFDINYLAEIMIFILIIGFVALLGVNLNMIVGEINIFQNLRGRKSKAVTRVVFVIFFGFHIYVIIYASVVAYSIYNWDNNAYVSNEVHYEITYDDDIYSTGVLIDQVYDAEGNEVDVLYDRSGNEVTIGVDESGNQISPLYYEDGTMAFDFYDSNGVQLFNLTDSSGNDAFNAFFYDGRLAVIDTIEELPLTYGDFLYWTIISVSTIGYGDIAPSNQYNIAQAWGGFLGLYGLTFFALSISFVSNIAMEGVNTAREESKHHD